MKMRLFDFMDLVRGVLGPLTWIIIILLLWYFIPYFKDLDIRYFILMTIVGLINFLLVFYISIKLFEKRR